MMSFFLFSPASNCCKDILASLLYYVAPKLAYLRMKEGVLDAGTGRVSIEVGLLAGLVGHETVFHGTMGIL